MAIDKTAEQAEAYLRADKDGSRRVWNANVDLFFWSNQQQCFQRADNHHGKERLMGAPVQLEDRLYNIGQHLPPGLYGGVRDD